MEVNKFSTPIENRLLLPALIPKTVYFNITSKVTNNNQANNTKSKNNNLEVPHYKGKEKENLPRRSGQSISYPNYKTLYIKKKVLTLFPNKNYLYPADKPKFLILTIATNKFITIITKLIPKHYFNI